MASAGFGSLLPVQLILLLSGGGLMGIPPGERDAAYLNCAPQKSLVYYEWSPSVAGKPGAPGVDGFMADPEIQQFRKKIHSVMTVLMKKIATRSPEGAQEAIGELPELASLMMGKSGCFYVNYEFPDNFDENSNPMEAVVGVHGTIIFNASENIDRVEEILAKLISTSPGITEPITNLDHFSFPVPEGQPNIITSNFTIHRFESYIIIGWGEGTVERAVEGLSGRVKGLGESEKFNKAMDSIKMERTAAVSWLNTQGALETVTKIMGPPGAMVQGVATMAGVSGVDSIASVTGVMEGQIRTRSLLVTDGETEGILSLASGRSMKVNDLVHIPIDADFAFAVTLNLPKMFNTITNLMGATNQRALDELEEGKAKLEDALGFSLEEDLLKAFGEVWTVYNSPSFGGFFITSPLLTLEVKDPGKAGQVYLRLTSMIKGLLDREKGNRYRDRYTTLMETEFLGQKIHFLNSLDDDVPIAPSICLTDQRLYFALHPQTIKAQLRLIEKNVPSFVQKLSKEIPVPEGDVIGFTYLNTVKLTNLVYSITPYIAQVAAANLQREGIDITIDDLPSAQAILPYMGNSWSAVVRVEQGILFESQTPIPVAGVGSMMFNLPMFMGMSKSGRRFNRVAPQIRERTEPLPKEDPKPEPKPQQELQDAAQ